MKKNIVFMGAKPIGLHCMSYLIENAINLNYSILALFTKKNPSQKNPIEILAEQYSIPIYYEIEELLNIENIDIIISVQYHQILKAKHIACAKQSAVNLHMAPLPEYRGCNQFSFAIIDEALEFGTSIHTINEGIDSGALLFENRFTIDKNIWVEELYQLTETASIKLFEENLKNIISENYSPIPQNELSKTRKSSFHLRNEIDNIKKIDLSWPAEKIERHIRATSFKGFEPPYTQIGNKKIYFQIAHE